MIWNGLIRVGKSGYEPLSKLLPENYRKSRRNISNTLQENPNAYMTESSIRDSGATDICRPLRQVVDPASLRRRNIQKLNVFATTRSGEMG
jgi:hypothetical protein